ncbi:MAG: hypothetical protein U0791_26840 [Gemmataceae bacterium]
MHLGRCRCCGKAGSSRPASAANYLEDALGNAANQLGGDAQAAPPNCIRDLELSHGQGRDRFDSLFGIKLTRGASSCQIGLRMAAKLEPDYKLILDDLKASTMMMPDETGWRIGGQPAWLPRRGR